jgi:radical SAM protein with 4Fe4S-binding SPASM domain
MVKRSGHPSPMPVSTVPAPALDPTGGFPHPLFGDLGRPGSVRLSRFPRGRHPVVERSFSTIHLTVTRRCFARCRGCINGAVTDSGDTEDLRSLSGFEADPERDGRCIIRLVQAGGSTEGAVCFYGGEPLLAVDALKGVVRVIDTEAPHLSMRYMIYTNGHLLEPFALQHPDLARRIFLYSVSVDGGMEQHDAIRMGTSLARIRQGLARISGEREGKVLIWSTLREGQSLDDCFREFLHLHEKGMADQFFWHWVETSEPFEGFERYLHEYEKDLRKVLHEYLRWLGGGRVLPVAHLNELVLYILTGKNRGSSGCGVEVADNFDLIAGTIHSCADLPMEMSIGRIAPDGTPVFRDFDLSTLVDYKKRLGCKACGVHSYCGGRCPVQAHISTPERLLQYCQLMRLHCAVVLEAMEEIAGLMRKHAVTAQRLYDESAFFTQFTDVTP